MRVIYVRIFCQAGIPNWISAWAHLAIARVFRLKALNQMQLSQPCSLYMHAFLLIEVRKFEYHKYSIFFVLLLDTGFFLLQLSGIKGQIIKETEIWFA